LFHATPVWFLKFIFLIDMMNDREMMKKEVSALKNLKKLRTERNLSQQALAQIMGVSQQSINKYETGKTQPDFHMLMAFAEFFHTSIDYLIGYTENPDSYRVVADILNGDEAHLSPYIIDKMKKTRTSSSQLLRETSASESPGIFDTTPKERYHLSMYRKLTPTMQQTLDAFLENIAPDDSYVEFMKGSQSKE